MRSMMLTALVLSTFGCKPEARWTEYGDQNYRFLLRSPITVAEYTDCVLAGECPSNCRNLPVECTRDDDEPAVCLNFEQATAAAAWVGGRLPHAIELRAAGVFDSWAMRQYVCRDLQCEHTAAASVFSNVVVRVALTLN